MAALEHDIDEAITGDTPNVAKRIGYLTDSRKAEKPDYPTVEEQVVKLADMAEAYLFLFNDSYMGNQMLKAIMADLEELWVKYCDEHGISFRKYGNKTDEYPVAPVYFLTALAGHLNNMRHPGMEALAEHKK